MSSSQTVDTIIIIVSPLQVRTQRHWEIMPLSQAHSSQLHQDLSPGRLGSTLTTTCYWFSFWAPTLIQQNGEATPRRYIVLFGIFKWGAKVDLFCLPSHWVIWSKVIKKNSGFFGDATGSVMETWLDMMYDIRLTPPALRGALGWTTSSWQLSQDWTDVNPDSMMKKWLISQFNKGSSQNSLDEDQYTQFTSFFILNILKSIYFLPYGCTLGLWKFLGPGSNPGLCSDPSHCSHSRNSSVSSFKYLVVFTHAIILSWIFHLGRFLITESITCY